MKERAALECRLLCADHLSNLKKVKTGLSIMKTIKHGLMSFALRIPSFTRSMDRPTVIVYQTRLFCRANWMNCKTVLQDQ